MAKDKSVFSPIGAWKYLTKKPVTIPKTLVFDTPREASDNYRGFHINDWDKCVGCGTCAEICPTNAINMIEIPTLEQSKGNKPERPAIDYGRCSFCALCVDICTSDSLSMSKEYIHLSKDADTFYFLPEIDGIHEIEYKDGYVRDEVSELLDLERYKMDEIKHDGRAESFMEIIKGYSKEMAIAEASRCVECGICTFTCPAHMNIPEYIKSVWTENMEEGIDYLYKTNPLSNVCGRVCTHTCESACVIGNRGKPVAIRWLKRYIIDNTPKEDFERVVLSNVSEKINGKVGIIGGGPAGLSCAYYLRTLGYEVDIYEEKPLLGGAVRYGVPEYRLPEESVKEDVEMIRKMGVNFIVNTKVGRDISFDEIKNTHDAVFSGTGNWIPKKLRVKNVDHPDIRFAAKFLQESRDYSRNLGEMPEFEDDLIVIGGGDVSFDVARSLLRLQTIKNGKTNIKFIARKPSQFLACDPEEFEEGTEEGLKFHLDRSPVEILIDDNNKIYGVKVARCTSVMTESGKAKTTCTDETEEIYAKEVFMSVGSDPDFEYFTDEIIDNLEISRNKIKVKEDGQVEGYPWLFAGGDITRGPDIITAVADGHKAAMGIDEYLYNKAKNKN
ncbi:FAD-dependent oxidoreductase [Helicovermis profundi]|uniref:FAD-dependent oxidoreductase n=1 Tax=Helicovermis profundi TaxID=3065157 RepID=A0AAU9EPZ8_9FIRM|nr:FAD-dependent oxidoreductase [Clostridia bacterium S502]